MGDGFLTVWRSSVDTPPLRTQRTQVRLPRAVGGFFQGSDNIDDGSHYNANYKNGNSYNYHINNYYNY